jgi:hypothetical protein
MERQIGSTRRECIDWLLIINRRHLERVLTDWFEHDNRARPHRGLDLQTPIARSDPVVTSGPVTCDERLGGLLREYSRAPMRPLRDPTRTDGCQRFSTVVGPTQRPKLSAVAGNDHLIVMTNLRAQQARMLISMADFLVALPICRRSRLGLALLRFLADIPVSQTRRACVEAGTGG